MDASFVVNFDPVFSLGLSDVELDTLVELSQTSWRSQSKELSAQCDVGGATKNGLLTKWVNQREQHHKSGKTTKPKFYAEKGEVFACIQLLEAHVDTCQKRLQPVAKLLLAQLNEMLKVGVKHCDDNAKTFTLKTV